MGDPSVGRSVPRLRASLNIGRRSPLHWLGPVEITSRPGYASPMLGPSIALSIACMFTEPGSTAEAIVKEERSTPRDVDGDGLIDALHIDGGSGSQFGGETLKLTLSRTGEEIRVDADSFFGAMVDVFPIPAALLEPGREAALTRVERALFGAVTTDIDPGMQWLLDHPLDEHLIERRAPSKLVFVDGDGPPMTTVVMRASDGPWRSFLAQRAKGARAAWVAYKGFLHTTQTIRDHLHEPEKIADVVVAKDESRSLEMHATCHGVYVKDTRTRRFAWAWVTPGNGFKMRFCSVGTHATTSRSGISLPFRTLNPAIEDNTVDELKVQMTQTGKIVRRPRQPRPE